MDDKLGEDDEIDARVSSPPSGREAEKRQGDRW